MKASASKWRIKAPLTSNAWHFVGMTKMCCTSSATALRPVAKLRSLLWIDALVYIIVTSTFLCLKAFDGKHLILNDSVCCNKLFSFVWKSA